jgi:RNA polymerase sigma factor (sigma-70 family)
MQTEQSPSRTELVVAAAQTMRQRTWAVCYRMTGNRVEADDLCHDAIARAIERADQMSAADPTGWILRIAVHVCLDHLRHTKVVRRLTELVDPLDLPGLSAGELRADDPERACVLREDVRYAVVVALQHLTPKQRAAIVLRDICDAPLEDVASAVGINENATKALLHRARAALSAARRLETVEVPSDRGVIERFARAIEDGNIDALADLLAEDAWGVVDGGGVIQTATKPNYGRRAIARQWDNGRRRLGQPVMTEVRPINGEPSIVIRLRSMPEVLVAIVHLETRDGYVVSLRVNRDPKRVAFLGVPLP